MKNRVNRWSAYFGTIVLLAGCASAAHIEKDDNADFKTYKTFAWIDKDKQVEGEQNRNKDITELKVREAVNKELEKSAGWHETKNRPDVLLNYDVLVERNVKESNNPVYSRPYSRLVYNPYTRRYATIYYPSEFMGYERDQRPVKEGTITISMIDTRSDRTVWQGWTTDEIDGRHMTSKEIQSSVRSIFKKFDIAKN